MSQTKSQELLFLGCTVAYFYPKIAKTTADVLKAANYDFTVLQQETCCGGPINVWGFHKDFDTLAERSAEAFRGFERIVTLCPMCYSTFRKRLPNYNIIHVTQALAELVDDGRLKFKNPIDILASYQDPCHLQRCDDGAYDARNLLKSIPGLKLVEMPFNREEARCCGGPIRFLFYDVAYNMAIAQLKDAESVGAEFMVTACPWCYSTLSRAARQVNVKVLPVIDLVAAAMGITKLEGY